MNFKIEKLNKNHKNFLYTLRNNTVSRKYSENKNKITAKEHGNWFKKNLLSKKTKTYIFSNKKEKIGYVRFNLIKSKPFVSIAILEKFRDKGISKKILKLAEKKINLREIFSKVHFRNKKSISLFSSSNYYILYKTKNFLIMKKNNSKNLSSKYLKIINQIENIRKKNNKNWMDILRIAFKYSPQNSAEVMKEIYSQDKRISILSEKLSKSS
jgi:hypothetical protein